MVVFGLRVTTPRIIVSQIPQATNNTLYQLNKALFGIQCHAILIFHNGSLKELKLLVELFERHIAGERPPKDLADSNWVTNFGGEICS